MVSATDYGTMGRSRVMGNTHYIYLCIHTHMPHGVKASRNGVPATINIYLDGFVRRLDQPCIYPCSHRGACRQGPVIILPVTHMDGFTWMDFPERKIVNGCLDNDCHCTGRRDHHALATRIRNTFNA